jgi:hypothetical protein
MKMQTLAAALAQIGKEGEELDSKAMTVLRIVRAEKINDGKSFNKAVREAYRANGWFGKPGKPKVGAPTQEKVPASVKQYVSSIRAAYRLKLHVANFTSINALRAELKEQRAKAIKRAHKANGSTPPEMVGIRLQQPDTLLGGKAIFHDLVALYDALDRTRKPKFMGALERTKREFITAAPQLVLQSAPEMRQAA